MLCKLFGHKYQIIGDYEPTTNGPHSKLVGYIVACQRCGTITYLNLSTIREK